MVRTIKNPVRTGLDQLCGGNDAAIARIFQVSRQSIGQWRFHSSIPRHYVRVFCDLTGVTEEQLLEYAEITHGVNFSAFIQDARRRAKEELKA